MKTVLVFDIETIPDASGLRRLGDYDPGLSDAEIVKAYVADRISHGGNDFLPLHLQKVAAISCVIRRSTKDCIPQFKVGSLGDIDSDEKKLVQDFFDLIERYTPQLVSWNGGGFDLPVLNYRALINGVVASRYWEMGESGEYDSREFKWNNYIGRYHLRHLDLMDVLARYQGKANAPLDALAKLCGFPGKLGMDGSQVWPAYLDGKLAAIRNYCETDVVNTYLVYCKYQLMRGGFTQEEFDQELKFVKASLAKEAQTPTGTHWDEYLAGFEV